VTRVATRAERATSFGAIAADYDRLRSGPADEAIDWLLPAEHAVVADLAAGTGLLSRVLARKAQRVVAIELDGRMAAVLRARSPGVQVLQGRGEALPLAAASMDAVLIASAWHWLDPERAVPELGRVLRSGGRLGVLWTSVDAEAGWPREVRRWRRARDAEQQADGEQADGETRPDGERQADGERRRWSRGHRFELPETDLFTGVATASFGFTRQMKKNDFVDMLATYSGVITLSEEERAAELAQAREDLERLFPGATQIDVPMRTLCWRADRTAAASAS
jgi:SAM-dependent methyltransferase